MLGALEPEVPIGFRREEVLLGTELAVAPCFRGANAISVAQPDLDVGVFRGSSQGQGTNLAVHGPPPNYWIFRYNARCKVQQDVVRWQQAIC